MKKMALRNVTWRSEVIPIWNMKTKVLLLHKQPGIAHLENTLSTASSFIMICTQLTLFTQWSNSCTSNLKMQKNVQIFILVLTTVHCLSFQCFQYGPVSVYGKCNSGPLKSVSFKCQRAALGARWNASKQKSQHFDNFQYIFLLKVKMLRCGMHLTPTAK